jgi:cytochrome oxidase assembly protein ShyY1
MRLVLPGWVLAILVVLAELTLLVLGAWQWQRLDQKRELEAAFDARTAGAPRAAAEVEALPPAERDFEVISLTGRWDTERVFRVSNRYRNSILGEEAIVPLVLADGSAVLVNRGWYPIEERDRVLAELRADSVASAPVRGQVQQRPDLDGRALTNGTWSRFDVTSMGASLPYPTHGWAVIEGERVEGDTPPISRELPVTGWIPYRNTVPHFEYALTWWGLALVLPVVAVARLLQRRRGTDHEAPARASV